MGEIYKEENKLSPYKITEIKGWIAFWIENNLRKTLSHFASIPTRFLTVTAAFELFSAILNESGKKNAEASTSSLEETESPLEDALFLLDELILTHEKDEGWGDINQLHRQILHQLDDEKEGLLPISLETETERGKRYEKARRNSSNFFKCLDAEKMGYLKGFLFAIESEVNKDYQLIRKTKNIIQCLDKEKVSLTVLIAREFSPEEYNSRLYRACQVLSRKTNRVVSVRSTMFEEEKMSAHALFPLQNPSSSTEQQSPPPQFN